MSAGLFRTSSVVMPALHKPAAFTSAVVIASLVMAACTTESKAPAAAQPTAAPAAAAAAKRPVTIGVAMKTQKQRRWAFDVQAMQAEADKLGAKLLVQWANDDPSAQSSQVENLLSQGITALILTPVDDKAAGASATAAKAKGVPVVSYDIGVQGVPVDYLVVRDNAKVGVLQAEQALKVAPTGLYALIEGDPANDVAQSIHTSHVSTLQGKNIKIVYDQFTKNWDPQAALSNAENILSSNNDQIAAFLTANDGMATGVIQGLKGRQLNGKVFVSGLDADPANLKAILAGDQTMSVWTQIDQQGKTAVDVAVDLANGKAPKPQKTTDTGSGQPIPTMLAPVTAVTKDNVCEFVTKIAPQGWVSVGDVFDNPSSCKG